jgi:hypothetical protein
VRVEHADREVGAAERHQPPVRAHVEHGDGLARDLALVGKLPREGRFFGLAVHLLVEDLLLLVLLSDLCHGRLELGDERLAGLAARVTPGRQGRIQCGEDGRVLGRVRGEARCAEEKRGVLALGRRDRLNERELAVRKGVDGQLRGRGDCELVSALPGVVQLTHAPRGPPQSRSTRSPPSTLNGGTTTSRDGKARTVTWLSVVPVATKDAEAPSVGGMESAVSFYCQLPQLLCS